jgi:hypothetical protein
VVEFVVDGGVNEKEVLGGSGRFESLHLSFSSSDELMGVFGPIVAAQALIVMRRQAKPSPRGGVGAQPAA